MSLALRRVASGIESLHRYSYKAIAAALEVLPRTLAQNCGADVGEEEQLRLAAFFLPSSASDLDFSTSLSSAKFALPQCES